MKYKTFEEMPVWQKAMDLAEKVFSLTEALPGKGDYGLTQFQAGRYTEKAPGCFKAACSRLEGKDKP
jgi:hypothetical protein